MISRTNTIYALLTAGLVVGVAICFAIAQQPVKTSGTVASHSAPQAAADSRAATESKTSEPNTPAQIRLPNFPEFVTVGQIEHNAGAADANIKLCQACGDCGACGGYFGPRPLCGVECGNCYADGHEPRWHDRHCLPFDIYGPGEYVGPARPPHIVPYRVRVDDQLQFVYFLSRRNLDGAYKFEVGDRLTIESVTDDKLNRHHLQSGEANNTGQGLIVQPDGSITLPLLGQVLAAGRTVVELTIDLEDRYKKYYKVPGITVTPLKVNTRLQDLKDSVDSRFGNGGLGRQNRVTPEGTVQLPAIGSFPVQGMTLEEIEHEVNARYAAHIQGIEVTVVLAGRAPRYVFVLGEVLNPGRYELTGPTTAMQSVALAGGWNNGGNLRQMVIFRRGEDWRLMATKLDLRGALLGKRPCPADELWIRDSDIVLVPKSALLVADNFIELVFTRGIYGVVPFQGISLNFARLQSI